MYFISTVDNYNVHNNITLDVETNLKVLCEVLDFCRDTNIVFNFISSWFVYGETELPAKEEYYCRPTGFYSITKKAAEDLLISFCRTYGVKYRILRLCNVMGNGDGTFAAKVDYITGSCPYGDPGIVDLNNDGVLDIVVPNGKWLYAEYSLVGKTSAPAFPPTNITIFTLSSIKYILKL